ncbi:AlpA family phage regulatory protein [Mariprofundus sp. KV]|uniref:helix-turn-helix transcriptional regulator n=1 Tax=Mariprofundus sp. KV TaxID=2608715 RepID=UPI0015A16824|nr:AlpA family phage regulatory protein [Mariprofundus sp. KV]NWF37509.1 AlpA family phage regulatory protein [Mariprofundus sp. KV]
MTIIRWAKLREVVPLSRSQVWRLEQDGRFPRRIKLSTNAVGWDSQEIEQWLQSRKGVTA